MTTHQDELEQQQRAGEDQNTDVSETEEHDGNVLEGEEVEADEDILDDYPEDTEEVDVTHLRVRSLASLGLKRFPNVKMACFRQNLVTSLDGVEDLPCDIEELDFYDNRLAHMDQRLAHFNDNMRTLDLSFNNIKHIKNIEHLTGLKTLYLCQNKISRVQGLNTLQNLRSIELGANRIREIKDLDHLVNLEELWLGKNKITKLQNLQNFKKLRILSIQANRITKLEGLEELTDLEELYIAENGIEKLEGLDNNLKLNTIDITSNKIATLENLSHLKNLEEFWASRNEISNFNNIEKELGKLPQLHTVYFEFNPVHLNNQVTYRNKVKLALGPSLKQIDATFIR
jgi:protein phosphatase 1 regulatory subunit 7